MHLMILRGKPLLYLSLLISHLGEKIVDVGVGRVKQMTDVKHLCQSTAVLKLGLEDLSVFH